MSNGPAGRFGVGGDAAAPTDTIWCRRTFDMIVDGGVWGVPRSGLVFKKTANPPTLTLTEAMPFVPELEREYGSAEVWRAFQRDDLEIIRRKFASAGITISGEID